MSDLFEDARRVMRSGSLAECIEVIGRLIDALEATRPLVSPIVDPRNDLEPGERIE